MALEAVTREEQFMAKAAGIDAKELTPITRKEMFLDAIAQNAGSGVGGGTSDTYTRAQIESKLDKKADLSYVNETFDDVHESVNAVEIELPNLAKKTEVGALQTKIDQDRNAIADISDSGFKNYINVSALTDHNVNGIIITVGSDGSLTFSGKPIGSSDIMVVQNINAGIMSGSSLSQINGHWLPGVGEYVLDFDNSDMASSIVVQCYASNDGSTSFSIATSKDKALPYVFSLDHDYKYIWFRIVIKNGADFTTPVTIRPMICKKSLYDLDPSFRPYVMSNAELTQEIAALKAQLAQDSVMLPDSMERPVLTMQESAERDEHLVETDTMIPDEMQNIELHDETYDKCERDERYENE